MLLSRCFPYFYSTFIPKLPIRNLQISFSSRKVMCLCRSLQLHNPWPYHIAIEPASIHVVLRVPHTHCLKRRSEFLLVPSACRLDVPSPFPRIRVPKIGGLGWIDGTTLRDPFDPFASDHSYFSIRSGYISFLGNLERN